MEKVVIVVAAYNEERAIGEVIKSLQAKHYNDIVVVDDGSKDRTSDIALEHGANVITHVLNRGQGAALKTGIDYALRQGADIIVTFDADGQHRVEDLPAMIKPVASGEVDVTLGSRFLQEGSNVPRIRKFWLRMGSFLFRVLYGVKLTDSHNGFRALSRHAAETIDIKADRMEHASEIIDQIGHHKLAYREIPIVIRYTEYSKAHSSQGMFPALKIFFRTITHKFLR
ncbi:glycosyltransferase family 2 protein [Candidatus Woesearchaeota archaeon]|nr:glycosyltransferase family 2 protein [Candidatus Woesearchaeota archaeon]